MNHVHHVIVGGHRLNIIVEWTTDSKKRTSLEVNDNDGSREFFNSIIKSIQMYVSMFNQLPSSYMYFTHSGIDLKINHISFDYKKKLVTFDVS
jgi:hypothetical protein